MINTFHFQSSHVHEVASVHLQGGKPKPYKTVKKTIDFCEKSPFKSVSYCPFHFVVLTKTRIGSENVAKKQGIYIGNFDAYEYYHC